MRKVDLERALAAALLAVVVVVFAARARTILAPAAPSARIHSRTRTHGG